MSIALTDRVLAHWFLRHWRGFHFLMRLRRRCTGRTTLLHRTRYGGLFALDPYDYIPARVLREGFYESEVFEALRPFLGEGAVFWDIGANIGLHAITAKFLAPSTAVVAFEPNPAMAGVLRNNAALNRVEIVLAPLALAAAEAERTLHVVAAGNPGMSTLHPWSQAKYDSLLPVHCARGDDLIARGRYPAPTAIKLDVEGGEADVLAGLARHLSSPELRAVVFEAESGLSSGSTDHLVAGPLLAECFSLTPLIRRENTVHSLVNYLAARP